MFFLPAAVVWTGWLMLMAAGGRWELFLHNWHMTVTMLFGSFIAGATSEGGGAVAFPVMTLIFNVTPVVARDFSLMIQTIGMGAASCVIFWQRIPVERHALLFASLGGAAGVILGLEYIHLPPAFAKMLFLSTWLAFAFALYWVNRYREREVHEHIVGFLPRHAVLLLGTGVIGGVVTSITGSGLDICTFSLLVLRLRINEKVGTPTSVVLMALNAAIGFFYKGLVMPAGMEGEAWGYWYVCVPIVVLGAPFGAWFIKNKSRLFIASILYFSIVVQFIWGILLLEVYRKPALAAFSAGVFAAGVLLFHYMAKRGVRRLEWLSATGKA